MSFDRPFPNSATFAAGCRPALNHASGGTEPSKPAAGRFPRAKMRVVSLIVACAMAGSAVAQTSGQTEPPQRPVPQQSGSSLSFADVVVGLFILGAIASGMSSSSQSDASETRYRYRLRTEESSSSGRSGPDTSAGCAWGDRTYGTCR